MHEAASRRRIALIVLSIFGGVSVLLAAIGLYGVIAQGVTQRRQEIGVRVALGATPREMLRLFLRQGLITIAAGLIVGLASAIALSRFIEDLLFGVTPNDQVTLWSVTAILLAVSVPICYLSARRSTRIEAAVALRE